MANILKFLDPIRLNMKYLSAGDIMRKTREEIGIKQWKLAKMLNVTPNMLKDFEYNRFPHNVEKQIFINYAELFDLEFEPLWKAVMHECAKTGYRVNDIGRHPYYETKIMKKANLHKDGKCKLGLAEPL